MTLEQLGFIEFKRDNSVYCKRKNILFNHEYEYIVFDLSYKEIELTNIDLIDMMLLEAIYTKAQELFV